MTEIPGLLFVLPSFPRRTASVDPLWVTTGGLAGALGARLGGAEVLTPVGVVRPDQMAARVVQGAGGTDVLRRGLRRLPLAARVGLGDVRELRRAGRMRRLAGSMTGRPYRLVIQHHRRFHDSGSIVARAVGSPLVLRVDALEVREEAEWGVRRPGWARIAERMGELGPLRRADLVASVSEEVDAQLASLGFGDDRRVVVPNGVDLAAFAPGETDGQLRRANGLDGRFVVGWVGGFRPFHGLEAVPEIARRLRASTPEVVLCLVGSGPLRSRIAEDIRGLEDVVRIVDAVPHDEVPRWMRSFDVCVLLPAPGSFHYSPLKLYEYLACGRTVVAPRVGQVARVVTDGVDGVLVPSGAEPMVRAIERLVGEPDTRQRLAREARRTAERLASWDARAATLLEAVEARGLLAPLRSDRSMIEAVPVPAAADPLQHDPSVVAVVLTYRRREGASQVVRELLESEGLDPDQVVLVVNGDGGLNDESVEERIGVLRLPENLGPAGGFARALEHVRRVSATRWVYLCEDDQGRHGLASPRLTELIQAVERFETEVPGDPVGVVLASGRHIDMRTGRTFRYQPRPSAPRFDQVEYGQFWGALVSRRVVESGVVPDEAMFWGAEDLDYWLRVRAAGFRVLVDTVSHRATRNKGSSDEPWCGYYVARNNFYLRRRHGDVRWDAWHILKSVRRFQLAKTRAHRTAILRGLVDGIRGRTGRAPEFSR